MKQDHICRPLLANKTKELRDSRKFVEVLSLLMDEPADAIFGDPELYLALAQAFSQLRRHSEALEVLETAKNDALSQADSILRRRWKILYTHELVRSGSLQNARALTYEVLDSAEDDGDTRHVAVANCNLGIIEDILGEAERSLVFYSRCVLSSRETGNHQGIAAAHFNIGSLLLDSGRAEEGATHLLDAYSYYCRYGIPEEHAYVTAQIALMKAVIGDLDIAERLGTESYELAARLPSLLVRADTAFCLGKILSYKRDPTAIVLLGEAVEAVRHLDNKPVEAKMCRGYGEALAILGAQKDSAAYIERALALYREMGATRQIERVGNSIELGSDASVV